MSGIFSDIMPLPVGTQTVMPFGLVQMIKTILLEDGRNRLFVNPHAEATASILATMNTISSFVQPDVVAAFSTLTTALTDFNEHMNRLSGAVEDVETNLPTLERALGIGSSLQLYSQGIDNATTYLGMLGIFSSIAVGETVLASIQEAFNNPTNIVAADLIDAATQLDTAREADANNYFVALAKLRRIGLASLVFGASQQPAEGTVITKIGSAALKEYVQDRGPSGDIVPTPVIPPFILASTHTTESGGASNANDPAPVGGFYQTGTPSGWYWQVHQGNNLILMPFPPSGQNNHYTRGFGNDSIVSFKIVIPRTFDPPLNINHIGQIKIDTDSAAGSPVVFYTVSVSRRAFDMAGTFSNETDNTGPGFIFTINNAASLGKYPTYAQVNFNSGETWYVNIKHTSPLPANFNTAEIIFQFASPNRYQ